MSAPLGDLSPEQFLQDYWQKKPCLIHQAIADFKPLLDGDDLAGLACEEMAESRLVSGTADAADWTVRHGPFSESDFSELPGENWTLLVQDVEKHYAPLQELMRRFSFLPTWRLDDLMVSYAATGGSVGPHTDQYDVFLLQAEGTRRWQIAHSFDPGLLQNCPLQVLQHFEAEQEWILEPGDMLYLPPNVAHYGVALEPGMTWSIGLRAPSAADLLQGLGEWLAFSADEGGRYTDPQLEPAARAGEIDQRALEELRRVMLAQLDDSANLHDYLAAFMSRFRLVNEPVPSPDTVLAEDVVTALGHGMELMRNPWTRLAWFESTDGVRLYAAGQPYECSAALAESLCFPGRLQISTGELDAASLATLTELIANGHFLLV